jgi:uroporphyrinogen decarboxylase
MNKKERVRAALQSRQVDRVPASFWFHFPSDRAQGQAAVDAHLDFYQRSGVDFLKVMNEHPYQPGVEIQTSADWRRLRPAPLSAPFFQNQLDELRRVLDLVGDECLVITTMRNPLQANGRDTAGKLATAHLKSDPESVSQGFSAIAESLARYACACLEAGAAGIYYSAKGGEVTGRFTEDEFLTYVKPHDLTILSAIADKGEFNLLHICGERIRLPLYADYPSHAVNWAVTKNAIGIAEGRALFGRPVVGGMDNRGVVVTGSPDEIHAEVRRVIASAPDRGFLLGADCTYPSDIDVGRLRIAVDAAADQRTEGAATP